MPLPLYPQDPHPPTVTVGAARVRNQPTASLSFWLHHPQATPTAQQCQPHDGVRVPSEDVACNRQ
eukprot:4753007-Prymnesium_polylepis.1